MASSRREFLTCVGDVAALPCLPRLSGPSDHSLMHLPGRLPRFLSPDRTYMVGFEQWPSVLPVTMNIYQEQNGSLSCSVYRGGENWEPRFEDSRSRSCVMESADGSKIAFEFISRERAAGQPMIGLHGLQLYDQDADRWTNDPIDLWVYRVKAHVYEADREDSSKDRCRAFIKRQHGAVVSLERYRGEIALGDRLPLHPEYDIV